MVGPGKTTTKTTVRPPRAMPSLLPSRVRKAMALAHQPRSMIINSCTVNQHGQNMLQLQVSIICPVRRQAIIGLSVGRVPRDRTRAILHLATGLRRNSRFRDARSAPAGGEGHVARRVMLIA